MPSEKKRIRIAAGPNGSGKSTILATVLEKYTGGPLVNADDIEKVLRSDGLVDLKKEYGLEVSPVDFQTFLFHQGNSWNTKAQQDNYTISLRCKDNKVYAGESPQAYDAALAADFIRHSLFSRGESFTFETVMSHRSKLDFLEHSQRSGYRNYLYFVCTVDPAINIGRINSRVGLGGHFVPEEKIIRRFKDSLALLPAVLPFCYRIYFFDNSKEALRIDPVAEISPNRNFTPHSEDMPWWIDKYVTQPLYR